MISSIHIKYQKPIAIISLNKPDRHNAFDDKLIKELTSTLLSLQGDSEIKVVILAANGKNFSAGADLEWMKRMIHFTKEENFEDAMQLVTLLKTLANFNKPTIALVQGKTLGGGVGLVASCDIVVGSTEASFCFSEAKLGLIPATIAPYVIAAIGLRSAQYYFLTASTFDVVAAQHMGLVHVIEEEEQLYKKGIEIANDLLQNGPNALSSIKKLIAKLKYMDQSLLQETAQLIADIRISDEAQEGLMAFLEKRKPNWINGS